MLLSISTSLVLSLVLSSVFRECSTESQILDCANSTKSVSCSDQHLEPENSTPREIKADHNSTSYIRRDISQVCANGSSPENGDSSLVCSSDTTRQSSFSSNSQESKRPLEVFIRTPYNATQFDLGSSLTIECAQTNQSISSTEADSPLTIIAATTRIWTVPRNGGLDLELNNYQEEDTGNYFCQALASDTGALLSESSVRLGLNLVEVTANSDDADETSSRDQNQAPQNIYSQENLSGLLPSLKVEPQYEEVASGDTVQLVCMTTTHDDPDPDASSIEWSFDFVENRKQLLDREPSTSNELPFNVSVFGNVLVVWSMSEEHCGLYRCTVRLADFNLSVQAVGELTLKPASDSAPLVFVTPEIARLAPNNSAKIQCEATGYPPPELVWYRVEVPQSTFYHPTVQSRFNDQAIAELPKFEDGLLFELIAHEDAPLYCEKNRCQSANHRRSPITSVSLIHLDQARAEHQGQWVCRATNKHGSNQASALIDVEFREPPLVEIAPELREQTIVLSEDSAHQKQRQNATFRCSIKSGKPLPRLHWLRTTTLGNGKVNNHLANSKNLDIYDLTKISSATSNVSIHQEDRGRSLVLVVGTISLDDEGDYVCLGENEWGRHSATARLTVRQPASVRILQASPIVGKPNDSFLLECLASGHPAPMDIEWSRSDRGAFFSLISATSGGSAQRKGHERAVLKFDRVGVEDSGEYTCNARDPLNGSLILRDTIMVLIENGPELVLNKQVPARDALLPKLMVRPTKVAASLGSNVTLDCLAVSGLQPTVVEWIAPQSIIDQQISAGLATGGEFAAVRTGNQALNGYSGAAGQIWPYYRTGMPGSGQLAQFGSKLRILNVSKQHEGVYQCKGSNKVGTENAPALVRVLESEVDDGRGTSRFGGSQGAADALKTKVAKVGSNIELKCQVNGQVEQPATSWSRDGLELPAGSVQIEHNLWIQNVSQEDSGLYVCSARSQLPNKVIQAKINLLVSGQSGEPPGDEPYNLSAKIVPSKSMVNLGDSLTLECIVTSGVTSPAANQSARAPVDLEEIERNVIWTNALSGQSVFQENVYVLNNLLIIYELRSENSATYRCNYNDFTQYTDYRLQVADANGDTREDDSTTEWKNSSKSELWRDGRQLTLPGANGHQAQLEKVALGGRLTLDCPTMRGAFGLGYRWARGQGTSQRAIGVDSAPLVLDTIRTSDADIYFCYYYSQKKASGPTSKQQALTSADVLRFSSFVVQVLVPVARFVQRPVSFISLPSISGANQQLEIELKFLPERDHGLVLFNGQRPWNKSSVGDYISLGLNKGFVEFRFELGDGTTLLRSVQSVALNQWHRVLIERNRRGAIMWLDKQPPISNSSAGKFFNLNLDSVLYVGGNQYFLNRSRSVAANQSSTGGRFLGYSRGFQGCVSLLRIGRQEINLMARNRSASIGIYECDKPECRHSECGAGICQVDRVSPLVSGAGEMNSHKVSMVNLTTHGDQRCLCPPGLHGERCELHLASNMLITLDTPTATMTTTSSPIAATSQSSAVLQHTSQVASGDHQSTSAPSSTARPTGGACELLNPCSANGTQSCQSLTSTSFKCHCQLGFTGDTCSRPTQFSSETSLWFNQQAYLQFRFNRPEDVQAYNSEHPAATGEESPGTANSNGTSRQQIANNLTNFARLTSMAESQTISFGLQTKSSYGLIYYMGQAQSLLEEANATSALESMSQTSKSMVANLLARLSSIVFDYLALALVDGHIELSYELGSGLTIIRSSERVNDGLQHQLLVERNGRWARLTIDGLHKHEASSPGKLSMLNAPADIYLGGLPHLAELTHNMYMSGFVGCVSRLQINSLGPINLIRSDHLTQVRSARNLAPCGGASEWAQPAPPTQSPAGTSTSTTSPQTTLRHKPYHAPDPTESDDPDEM